MNDKEKCKLLWDILVMIKRDLDDHLTNPDKLELPKSTWDEAVDRANKIGNPHEQ